jgi:DNA polymerase elongation subunit (family B)
MVSPEIIENFLNGNNPLKYVIGIEANYSDPYVNLIINDPLKGKFIQKYKYKPFLWFKDDVKNYLYGGKRDVIAKAKDKFKIRTKKLITSDSNGFSPDRLENGYKFLATTSGSYNDLILFFKNGGVDLFNKEYSKLFFMFTPVEQFMIQSGIRLFKGMDDYNDLHRFQFDLETEGLNGEKDAIFQIGMRDNRNYEEVLDTIGETPQEKRDCERKNIIKFFNKINELKPDIISGYNSESFDWKFILDRAERLNLKLDDIAVGLDGISPLKRKQSILKLGNEMESFNQTYMYGHNIIDIAHSVRRAQAINSNIKSWGLKYITKYSDIAKKNRVYVKGDKIYSVWSDKKNQYAFNDENGNWYKISDKTPLKDNYKVVNGSYIIERYLLDDLWETEQIDIIFNQAAFLISKLLPTTYSRSTTMGTASQWKLIMAAWSYENNLAIPETQSKREFTGGLSRLLEVGYSKNVVKMDYAALYPKNQLTHDIFPDLDISGVMKGMLTYIVDTRDKFKFLTENYKGIVKKLKKEIDNNTHSSEKRNELEEEYKKNKALVNLYDKKQLPLKILANSWFGAYGAPYIFNWGDTNCAEETTCRGRQYLRLMVRYFTEKYGFKPLVLDTDGVNFKFPENIDNVKYLTKGSHWKTTNYANQELVGLNAVLAEFNETYMSGRMGLDIDEICNSTINFSRKNYATDIEGKIKFVGNSIKNKKMPVYIEDFLDNAIRLLLDGKGKEFINYYYEYVDMIYNYNIPIVKIASKSKVKSSLSDYKLRSTKKNKIGNNLPPQAHMELAIKHNLKINLGDTIYYVNIGTKKTDGDAQKIVEKKIKLNKKELQYEINNDTNTSIINKGIKLNCKLIDSNVVENNMEIIKEIESLKKTIKNTDPNDTENIDIIKNKINELEKDLLTDEYNVEKYLEAFNNKVKPLLVCFHPDIRNKILLKIKKDKKTKVEKLDGRNIFTDDQCKLVSGLPNKADEQDSYEELMTMEDKEIKFWNNVNKIPNNISEEEWILIKNDYNNKIETKREEGIKYEIEKFDDIIRRLELEELNDISDTNILPDSIMAIANIDDDGNLISKKWEFTLGHLLDIFKYENEAIQRNEWYDLSNIDSDDKYELWLEYKKQNNIVIKEKIYSIYTNTEENQNNLNDIELKEDIIISDNKGEIDDEWNF